MTSKRTRLYWKVHSVCALYTGGLLAMILISGAFAVFTQPIYDWEFRHLSRVEDAALDYEIIGPAIERATSVIATEMPTASAAVVFLPKSDEHSLRIQFRNSGWKPRPFVPGQPWLSRSVFVHPSTGAILGEADDDRSLAVYLRNLHVRFFAGTPGRNLVGLLGVPLLVLCISGLMILWRFLANKSLWRIRWHRPRSANADVHMLIGLLLCIPVLVFAITGFWLGMQVHLMNWFSIERPSAYEREAIVSAREDVSITVDFPGAIAAIKAAHPDLVIQRLSWSDDGQRTLRARGRTPGMIYERYSQGVVLDKLDHSVLKVTDTANARWQEKLFYLQEALHFGDFGGFILLVVYFVIGLLIGLLPLTGYAIWRLRSRASLRPFWRWCAFGLVYAVGGYVLLRSQGIIIAASYGTLSLWLFVLGMSVFWGLQARKKRKLGRGPRVRVEL